LRADFANSAHLPQYYQINLSADRKFPIGDTKNLDIRLAAINVTDRVYLLRDGSGIGVGAPQYGPRRGLYLGFDMAF
jgi:outer membrane receptor protein involved in Fe transport